MRTACAMVAMKLGLVLAMTCSACADGDPAPGPASNPAPIPGAPPAGTSATPSATIAAPPPPPVTQRPAPPSLVASFDGSKLELPESVALHDGIAYVSFLNGAVVRVTADGKTTSFGHVPIEPAGSAFALGLTVDGAGNALIAVAKASATSSFPAGVYRIPTAGGDATLIARHEALNVPNDVKVDAAGNVFITDAPSGTIFRAAAGASNAEVWSQDALLQPSDGSESAPCGKRTSPFPIGANGLVVEQSRIVITNTEAAALIAIPILPDGKAGSATILARDNKTLCGADGLAVDADGSFLATIQSTTSLARIGTDGSVKVLHSGSPFLSPAAVAIGRFGTDRRVIVVNPDFAAAFSAAGPSSAKPNLVSLSL